MGPFFKMLGIGAAAMFFRTYKRFVGTVSLALILLFLFYEPFRSLILGGLFLLFIVALFIRVIFSLIGKSPSHLFSTKKRN